MTIEEIEYYIKEVKSFVPMGFAVDVISVIPWPSKPFETTEHYIDFKLGNNLLASEKLSELTLEKFFEHCDVIIRIGEGYQVHPNYFLEWKKKELRNHRLSLIME